MSLSTQIAKHFRNIHFGGNWTSSNYKDQLADVTFKEANTEVISFNTIAQLTYHATYYVGEVLKVLQGGALEAKDKFSWEQPKIQSQQDWEKLQETAWSNATEFSRLVEQLPEDIWEQDFTDPKYGNYYGNITGIIEHLHYHLGQIVLLKKLIREKS